MQKRKKTFFMGIALLVLIAVAFAFYLYNKPHTSVSGDKTDKYISAEKLYADYADNEGKADSIYLNKVIEVKGEVENISDANGQLAIVLHASDVGGINCAMAKPEKQNISQKQMITIKGKCSGFLMDVNLVDCVIIQ